MQTMTQHLNDIDLEMEMAIALFHQNLEAGEPEKAQFHLERFKNLNRIQREALELLDVRLAAYEMQEAKRLGVTN